MVTVIGAQRQFPVYQDNMMIVEGRKLLFLLLLLHNTFVNQRFVTFRMQKGFKNKQTCKLLYSSFAR